MPRRFVLDSMLGKLAKWLRILGFDARCERIASQVELDNLTRDDIIVVTRCRRWLGRSRVVLLESNDPALQLNELITILGVTRKELLPLSRCIRCNEPLRGIPKREAFGVVPDYVYETQADFHQCPGCNRIYWPGSHSRRMSDRLALLQTNRTVGADQRKTR